MATNDSSDRRSWDLARIVVLVGLGLIALTGLSVIGTTLILFWRGQPVPEALWQLTSTVMGFLFGVMAKTIGDVAGAINQSSANE